MTCYLGKSIVAKISLDYSQKTECFLINNSTVTSYRKVSTFSQEARLLKANAELEHVLRKTPGNRSVSFTTTTGALQLAIYRS